MQLIINYWNFRMKTPFRQGLYALLLASCIAPANAVVVKDIAGRSVNVPDKVERILLGEGRLFYALSLLEGNKPLARIAGWQGDFRKLDPQGYGAYRQQFPEIDRIPLIGETSEDTISAEKVLTLKPDLAIFSISGHGPGLDNPVVQQLTRAGVPVIFVDFRNKPIEHTVPSLRLMGKAIQREKQAEAFASFYDGKLADIRQRLQGVKQRPLVFADVRAGTFDVPTTAGKGSFGEMIELAGGRNLGSSLLDKPLGQVNIEHVLVQQPSHYIATGAAGKTDPQGVRLGASSSRADALASLKIAANRDQLKSLPAAKGQNVMAAWHVFYVVPQHIVLIEAMAKWLHPAQFKDVDPAKTWAQLHQRFGALTPSGTYWVQP